MKKVIFTLLASCLWMQSSMAQSSREDEIKKAIQEGGKTSTGTLQDVLSNYLQIAAKNVTSNNSGVQLKLNWFALNGMDSAQKYSNTNFIKTAWQRNGEVLGFVGVNKDNKFSSLKAGINYNLLNRRDTTMAFYDKAYARPYNYESVIIDSAVRYFLGDVLAQLQPKVTAWFNGYYQGQPVPADLKAALNAAIPGMIQGTQGELKFLDILKKQLVKEKSAGQPIGTETAKMLDAFVRFESLSIIDGPLNAYIRGLGKTPLVYPAFISTDKTAALVKYIDDRVAQNSFFRDTLKATTLTALNKKVLADYNAMVRYVGRQPLLTYGYLYIYGKGSILSSHVTGLTYLQGLGGLNSQKTGQIKMSLTDSISSNDPTGKIRNFERNIAAFQVGYNQVLAMQKKVSVMEVSGSLEVDRALKGYISAIDKDKFYFNASFKARLPSSPWLKLDLKYDPKDGNVFGFLDFTYNLDKP